MKIYLAGKVTNSHWRESLVEGFDEAFDEARCETDVRQWPVLKGSIFNTHDYVGPYCAPYLINDTHGTGKHGGDTLSERVVDLCLDAIKRCDIVFAWIDTTDCYATFFEIGYAKALHKPVYIAEPKPNRDLWFLREATETHDPVADENGWKPYGFDYRASIESRLRSAIIDAHQQKYGSYNKYKNYCATDSWKRVRARILERDKFTCQSCGKSAELHVHHKTYERLGLEADADLITLCKTCHKALHAESEAA